MIVKLLALAEEPLPASSIVVDEDTSLYLLPVASVEFLYRITSERRPVTVYAYQEGAFTDA